MSILNKLLGRTRKSSGKNPSLIRKVSKFVACELIEGDYYEFGTYQGNSFINAFHAFKKAFLSRSNHDIQSFGDHEQADRRMALWNQMRFFAFDSFEGLPELKGIDQDTRDFKESQYACSVADFKNNLKSAKVEIGKTVIIPGWFNETCNDENKTRHNMGKAAAIWIDGDLYESAICALEFMTPLIQDGTVIIFDDWYAFRGNPNRGEQKAFSEWLEMNPKFEAVEYQKDGTWQNSFIISMSSKL